MGRRRRHDDEDDDALEREWLSKRQKVLGRGDSVKTEDVTTSSSKTTSHQTSTCQEGGTSTKKDATSIDMDKIERQRAFEKAATKREEETK